MHLEIIGAEEIEQDKFSLKFTYDSEFYDAVCKAFGTKFIDEDNIEYLIITVLENLTFEDLRKLGYEID